MGIPTLRMEEERAEPSMFLVPGEYEIVMDSMPWTETIQVGVGVHVIRLSGSPSWEYIVSNNGAEFKGQRVMEALVEGGAVDIVVSGGSPGTLRATIRSIGHM